MLSVIVKLSVIGIMTDNSIIFPGLTNPKDPSYKPSARVRTQYFLTLSILSKPF